MDYFTAEVENCGLDSEYRIVGALWVSSFDNGVSVSDRDWSSIRDRPLRRVITKESGPGWDYEPSRSPRRKDVRIWLVDS
jgi:hypothetical protein